MRIKPAFLLTSFALFHLSTMAYSATTICQGTLEAPCVVQDTKDTTELKNWRSAAMIADSYKGNIAGLKNQWVSASAMPNKEGFKTIAHNINKVTDGKATRILDIDLREESHALLNDEAITLNSAHNWINRGKTYQQTLTDEQNWQETLAQSNVVTDVLTPAQFDKGHFDHGKDVDIKTLASEQATVEKLGFTYARITVSDHMRPLDDQVDRFVALIKKQPVNTWIHVHCRGGNGRATTFSSMLDMLRNANRVSFDDIIKRQASVPPYRDLSITESPDPEMHLYNIERYEFLKEFYQYATATLNGYHGSWTDWLKDQTK